MTPFKFVVVLAAALLCALEMFTGCESSDSGTTHVTSNTYYGTGFYNPWYYGDYDDDRDVIIVPPRPGNRPDNDLHPEHPIASPPEASRPSPRPTPSIPSTPRPAFRGGGGGRR